MNTTAQSIKQPNKYGHQYDGQYKTVSGYAVCSACGCHENTNESIAQCPGGDINLDNVVVPVPTKYRQAAYKTRQIDLGRVGRKVWATPVEHESIKELLVKLRRT